MTSRFTPRLASVVSCGWVRGFVNRVYRGTQAAIHRWLILFKTSLSPLTVPCGFGHSRTPDTIPRWDFGLLIQTLSRSLHTGGILMLPVLVTTKYGFELLNKRHVLPYEALALKH